MVLTATAVAAARPDARAMTCGQVQAAIRQQGAVVMTTGPHTYDRFVGRASACLRPDIPWPATVRTRDDAQCPVYNCVNEDLVRPPFMDRW